VRLHGGLVHENVIALHASFVEGHYTVLVQEVGGSGFSSYCFRGCVPCRAATVCPARAPRIGLILHHLLVHAGAADGGRPP
jgi:hypothetical protein